MNLPSLKIGKLEARVPIIQGGMGIGISLAGLASAVANQGGIGVISVTGLGFVHPVPNVHFKVGNVLSLRSEIQKARSLTKGLLGVNILIALTDYGELAQTAWEEGIDFIFMGAGLPIQKPEAIPEATWRAILTKVVPIVSSDRAARIICRHWSKHYQMVPDAFVLEGPRAGGHLGFNKIHLELPEYQLESLLPEVIEAVKPFEEKYQKPISIIVGGGVFSGGDIFKFLQLGAQGVQLATRFIATYECDAADAFKQSIVDCKQEDLVIIDSPVGLPGRAMKNAFLQSVTQGLNQPTQCPWKCLQTCDFTHAPYCIAKALLSAHTGELDKGFVFSGANAYRVEKITSVKELMDSLLAEYKTAVEYFLKKQAWYLTQAQLAAC
ncbi:MAG: nitronate monooxygenase [Candidatus Firestonebacteria bacterium]|nr:nitronate monooxygenase [Candidatus Firestonebacteria bacterium]